MFISINTISKGDTDRVATMEYMAHFNLRPSFDLSRLWHAKIMQAQIKPGFSNAGVGSTGVQGVCVTVSRFESAVVPAVRRRVIATHARHLFHQTPSTTTPRPAPIIFTDDITCFPSSARARSCGCGRNLIAPLSVKFVGKSRQKHLQEQALRGCG
jgi:hypothetical protein